MGLQDTTVPDEFWIVQLFHVDKPWPSAHDLVYEQLEWAPPQMAATAEVMFLDHDGDLIDHGIFTRGGPIDWDEVEADLRKHPEAGL